MILLITQVRYVHFAHKTKWQLINFAVNTPHFLFPDSLCEQNEGTVQYFYIIIVDFCTQNILKDLIQGINRQIQKSTKRQHCDMISTSKGSYER